MNKETMLAGKKPEPKTRKGQRQSVAQLRKVDALRKRLAEYARSRQPWMPQDTEIRF